VIISTISLGHLIHGSLMGVPVPGWQLPIIVHVRLLDVRRRWPLSGLERLRRAEETETKDALIRTVGRLSDQIKGDTGLPPCLLCPSGVILCHVHWSVVVSGPHSSSPVWPSLSDRRQCLLASSVRSPLHTALATLMSSALTVPAGLPRDVLCAGASPADGHSPILPSKVQRPSESNLGHAAATRDITLAVLSLSFVALSRGPSPSARCVSMSSPVKEDHFSSTCASSYDDRDSYDESSSGLAPGPSCARPAVHDRQHAFFTD